MRFSQNKCFWESLVEKCRYDKELAAISRKYISALQFFTLEKNCSYYRGKNMTRELIMDSEKIIPWKKLPITNTFMFNKVLASDMDVCKGECLNWSFN